MGSLALTALVSLLGVLSNVFVVKQMELFGWTVTCSDVFAIGGILGLNLLQESWGREAAQKAIKISLLCFLFFIAMTQIHLLYLPSLFDRTQGAFSQIFSSSPRIVLASISVYYAVQKLDVRLFGMLKTFFSDKFLPMRLTLSLLISQLFDTILFSFLGLYGLVESIFSVICLSYLVKCLIIASSSSFVGAVQKWIKPA